MAAKFGTKYCLFKKKSYLLLNVSGFLLSMIIFFILYLTVLNKKCYLKNPDFLRLKIV